MRVQVPRGSVDGRAADMTLAAIRHLLAAAGVKGDIEVGFLSGHGRAARFGSASEFHKTSGKGRNAVR